VNYGEFAGPALQVTDGSGQTWRISTKTGSIATVGNAALLSTNAAFGNLPLSDFTTVVATEVSEGGQEANLVLASTNAARGDARLTHSLMASPDQGYARYMITIAADPTIGFDLTGEAIGLDLALGTSNLIGARDIASGSFSTTLDITDSGAVFDDSTSGAGGNDPSLSVVWGDHTMGDAVDGNDLVRFNSGTVEAVYDDLSLVAGASASFLYFFSTNPDAGSGFGDVVTLSTPDFRDLAGLSAAEVASILNFDLDESDRLETVLGFGAGNDSHAGNYWGELIDGAGGNDNLSGGGSDDVLRGGTGDDILDGGTGNDSLFGGDNNDVLNGSAGSDDLSGGLGADVHIGGDDAGIDLARYDDANHGNLTIRLDNAALNTGAAAGDTYVGIEGLVGGLGNDTIYGNSSSNHLIGGGGADLIYSLNGADTLSGGTGGDNLWGGAGADAHVGGDDTGLDFARYDDANYGNLTIRLDASNLNAGAAAVGDTYTGIEGLVGGLGNDIIVGNSLSNYLIGGSGADLIYGLNAADTLSGGAGGDNLWGGSGADAHVGGDDTGLDFARYDDANYGNLTIRLDASNLNAGAAAVGDTYAGIEGLVGGLGNDVIVGNSLSNYLIGGGGADQIFGLSGADTLSGGAGADRFAFITGLNGSTNVDTIIDFAAGVDDIQLGAGVFSAIGASLTADEFRIGSALDAKDFILYNNITGALFYDSNGSGVGGATQFATVTAGTALTFDDFIVA